MHSSVRYVAAFVCWGAFVCLHQMSVQAMSSDTIMAVTLDWVPTPEYYGFFYAKDSGIYKKYGFDVKMTTASGAPVVASQLAAGQIYLGTTTSDNILRSLKESATYTYLVPLARYNPVALVSLATQPIISLEDMKGKVLGVNPQSGAYAQLIYLMKRDRIPLGAIREYPIGFGGALQLQSKKVQAFLAYTTNQAVDMEVSGYGIYQLHFDTLGIKTYGLVLAAADESIIRSAGRTDDEVRRFAEATLMGYKQGGNDIPGAIESLMRAEPTLNRTKLDIAIRKMQRLNTDTCNSVPDDLDAWVDVGSQTEIVRRIQRELFDKGLHFVRRVMCGSGDE